MTKPIIEIIPVDLHVAHVGAFGNIADGKYFYSCSPKIVNISQKNTLINFMLNEDSDERFEVVDIFFTDLHSQVTIEPATGPKGRSITVRHKNEVQALTFFSILVRDNKLGVDVNCDPQATNVPPP